MTEGEPAPLLSSSAGVREEAARSIIPTLGIWIIGEVVVIGLAFAGLFGFLDPLFLLVELILLSAFLLLIQSHLTWQHFAVYEHGIAPQYRRLTHAFRGQRVFPFSSIAHVDSKEDETPLGKMWAFKIILDDGTFIYVRRMPEYPPQSYDALKLIQTLVNSRRMDEIPSRLKELVAAQGEP